MKIKKVKGGFRIVSSVGGYPFNRTYRGYNRVQAIYKHNQMQQMARRYGDRWIDQPQFNEYNCNW